MIGRRRGISLALGVLASASAFGGCEELGQHELTIGPNPAGVGESVDFLARVRSIADERAAVRSHGDLVSIRPELLAFRWDLDGDGAFEQNTPAVPAFLEPNGESNDFSSKVSRSYASPQTITVSSFATLSAGGLIGFGVPYADGTLRKQELTITPQPSADDSPRPNQPPLASFTVTPNPVEPHQEVVFDASDSHDPDGSIAKYEWDMDGLGGTYERDTGTNPRTARFYDNSGTYQVGLRVTDNSGTAGTTARDVIVRFDPRTGRVTQRAAQMPRFEFTPSGRTVNEGVFLLNGDKVLLSRAKARGTLPADAFPAPLRGSHDVRWAADYVVDIDTQADTAEIEAFVLLTFPTGGRACLGANLMTAHRTPTEGDFRVLGGIGRAARLRGLGTATGTLEDDGRPLITGRGRFRLADEANYGLGRGKCGPLRRLAPQRD